MEEAAVRRRLRHHGKFLFFDKVREITALKNWQRGLETRRHRFALRSEARIETSLSEYIHCQG
jgi:hypothetical protein